MEPWSSEIFVEEPGAQSLSRLGARTKMLFLAKWSPGMKQWSPRAPNLLSWSTGAQHVLGWSPGALNPFGTLNTDVQGKLVIYPRLFVLFLFRELQ